MRCRLRFWLIATACNAALNLAPSGPVAKSAEPAVAVEKRVAEKRVNRLSGETSPYLLLHAHNPVEWYPWGEEALARAKREKKPIFLSIGYSSCYWCHVMERESFQDDEIAALLNKHFVCIKVDREERPDIDEVYMRAVEIYLQLAGSGQGGGWPLTVFLTPDARPLLGATYFPPRDRQGQTGLLTVVRRVHEAWTAEPAKWQKTADRLAEFVQDSLRQRPSLGLVKVDAELLDEVQAALAAEYDSQHGGFGFSAANPRKPKFPEPSNLFFLLQRANDGNAQAGKMLHETLAKMASGGIRDHVGGGFHRYSTDRAWRIPHFEKMLYDNGQLASLYARAYQLEPRDLYKQVVEEILEFVSRELSSAGGGFYSALDAETDGREGEYYVWDAPQIKQLLTATEFGDVARLYGVGGEPNFERRYVLLIDKAPDDKPAALDPQRAERLKTIESARAKLLAARSARPRPLTDTKILTGWNGLMMRGYADAGRILGQPRYTERARRAAEFVLGSMCDDHGRLYRCFAKGQAKLPAFLDDYALFIDGLLALHEATGERRWLRAADQLTKHQIELFWDERAGGFFYTSREHEQLFARSKIPTDGALPSGNSISASNLIYLARELPHPDYLARAEKTIDSVAPLLKQSPTAAPRMATALDELLRLKAAGSKK